MPTTNIISLVKANFDTTIHQHNIILLDFWGQQCPPCHAFAKVLEEVAPDYPQILFAKINTDEEQTLAQEFSIRSVPFIMIMRERVVLYADSGALPASVLRELLEDTINLDMESIKTNKDE